MAISKKREAPKDELAIEETKTIKVDVPLSAYRMLTKLAADSVPFVKVSPYCVGILVSHANEKKGKKG